MSKITAYATLASPSGSTLLPVVDTSDTSMAASGTTKKMTLAALKSYALASVAPSGLTSSADTTAVQNALNSAAAGTAVLMLPGTWTWTSTVTIPAGVWLVMAQGYRSTGSQINLTSTFSGTSAVAFAAATPCGGVQGLVLNGSAYTATAIDGILCTGGAKFGSVIGVNVSHFTGHGINITASGGNPDGWYLHEVSSHDNGGDGVHWDYAVDGQMDVFHLDHNTGSGLSLGTMNNMTFSHGKCQQNTNYGVALTGGFVKSNSTFSGVFTENNLKDGWNLNATGGGQGSIQLAGCSTRDDGTSGTSGSGYSGYVFNTRNCDIMMGACSNYITASTAGPDYGLVLISTTGNCVIAGCSLIGSVSAYHDGGGNTSVQWGRNTLATGQNDGTRTLAYSDTSGKATFSGNGATTAFTISHGLAGTPASWSVTAASAAANGAQFTAASATQLTVTFAAAPATGTNNVVLAWTARL